MRRVFADSFYFFALLNPRDASHRKAVEFSRLHTEALVTTAWALTELADGLARSIERSTFRRVVNDLAANPDHLVVPPSSDLLNRGMDLYDARHDKQWSLTDCISFVVMQDYEITDALTGDHHFEQAGFRALLK